MAEGRTEQVISFRPEDMRAMSDSHNDILFIQAMIANYELAWIFIDFEILVNVSFKEAMNQIYLGEYKTARMVTALFGFTWHDVYPVDMINPPPSG